MAGGYGFDTGQRPRRAETPLARQTPRGGVPERSEMSSELAQFLRTDPRSFKPDAASEKGNAAAPLAKRPVSTSLQWKPIKHLLHPHRSEKSSGNEMEIKGVARRQLRDGRPFFQILLPECANSTYCVNLPSEGPVEPPPVGKLDKWKRAIPQHEKSSKKKRRSKKALSASTFLGLPQPNLNLTDMEQDIPHLIPKKTKSRHTRQMSPSKLNTSHLPYLARLRPNGDNKGRNSFIVKSFEQKREEAIAESKAKQEAPTPSPTHVMHAYANESRAPLNGTGEAPNWRRKRATYGLTPINTSKKSQRAVQEPVKTVLDAPIVQSSEVAPPRDTIEPPDWRAQVSTKTSGASNGDSSAAVSPQSMEAKRSVPPGFPTPAPTGPLPPLPDEERGLPGRRSNPIVIASDIMTAPEGSPQKKSPSRSSLQKNNPFRSSPVKKSHSEHDDTAHKVASRNEHVLADLDLDWSATPSMSSSLPLRVKSEVGEPLACSKALGDPFEHRIKKIKAMKQRDVQHHKAVNGSHASKSASFVSLASPNGSSVAAESEISRPGVENPAEKSYVSSATKPRETLNFHPDPNAVATSAVDAAKCLSPIMTVAELPPPRPIGRAPSPSRTRITYRSHSTQYSPYRFNGVNGSEKKDRARQDASRSGPPLAYDKVRASLEHSGSSANAEINNASRASSDIIDPMVTPTASPRRRNGGTPMGSRRLTLRSSKEHIFGPLSPAKSPSRQASTANGGHPVHSEELARRGSRGRLGELEGRVEARLRAFERKTVLLEAALLAVINASAGLRGENRSARGSLGRDEGVDVEGMREWIEES